jgi:hypothetical protein
MKAAVRLTDVGQVVNSPRARRVHHEPRMGDVSLLLLDTLASIRMRRRLVVLDPLDPLTWLYRLWPSSLRVCVPRSASTPLL